MKLLIASDIHGSAYATEKLLERAGYENAEEIFILGDVYNHGPRNPLPEGYDPIKTANLLNGVKNLTVIKGNCDSEVDGMISDFAFAESAYIYADGIKLFLTHGHKFNYDNIPKFCKVLVYGHTHIGGISEKDGIIIANTGSVSLPKNGSAKSYLLLDGDTLILKSLDGEEIERRGLK